MNYRGSSRHLVRNAKSALLGAIEIYNKPGFPYRDECFVILLLNAWELVLKALISKHGESIYYPKKRKEQYRTLSMDDALVRAERFFPHDIAILPVRENLNMLSTYRDNAVHFYNEPDFSILVYALAQTSIVNFRDLLEGAFGFDLTKDISWQLLPLGLRPPVDPVAYMAGSSGTAPKPNSAAKQFITALAVSLKNVEDAGVDAGRLLTVFRVGLQSIKKLEQADLVVGVTGSTGTIEGPLILTKLKDPNITHPLRQMDVIAEIGDLHGRRLTSGTFQALCYRYGLKERAEFCWKDTRGILIRYSRDLIPWIKRLSQEEVETALSSYRQRPRTKQ